MMKVNLLAVSVGNTHTRLGAFVEGELVETVVFINPHDGEIGDALEQAVGPLRKKDDTAVLLASVNPSVCPLVVARIREHLDRQVWRVDRDVPIPIGRQLDPEAIVGEDRLVNAAAAYDVLKEACVVVDAGTAITVDYIDGTGTFHGGAIGPGGQLMLDALNRRTAQLPQVQFAPPVEPIGRNSVEAMRAGVFHGLRGMVRELVERYAEQVGAFPLVVATGGDADLLLRDYDLVDRVVPDLTLLGLAVTMRVALENRVS